MKYIALIFVVILMACSGINKDKLMDLKLPPFKPNLTVQSKNDSMRIDMNYFLVAYEKNAKSDFINSIKSVDININLGNRSIRSTKVKPEKINKQFGEFRMSYALFASAVFLLENKNLRQENLTVELVIATNSSIYSYKKSVDECLSMNISDNREVMDLLPTFYKIDTSTFAIGLLAKRNRMDNEEYLPSSEEMRAEVYSKMGSIIWSSNQDMNYTMQIGKVLPDSVDQTHLYLYQWDFMMNSGRKIPDGDYKIKLTIPAKPHPYFVISDFNLGGIND